MSLVNKLVSDMAKLITAMRLRTDRAEKLRDMSIDLTIKSKTRISETELINYLIDRFGDKFDIDKDGIFLKDEDE